jgi:hypothetical protein
MSDNRSLLTDEQMKRFIVDGYVVVHADHPEEFHQKIFQDAEALYADEGNPGNSLTEKIPDLLKIWKHPAVDGALRSILGPGYVMHPHRHGHLSPPQSAEQSFHLDSYEADENMRHHRCRWVLALYYPQDVEVENGPTQVLEGSQYHTWAPDRSDQVQLPFTGPAGSVMIIHYELWHRAMPNLGDRNRFMMKFLFFRVNEPEQPVWNAVSEEADGNGWESPHFDTDLYHPMWNSIWAWHCGKTDQPSAAEDTEMDELIAALSDESEAVRLNAAYRLAAHGEIAVPALIEELRRESESKRDRNLEARYTNPSQLLSVYALSAIGLPAVPPLTILLGHEDWWVRAAAADALGDIGPLAVPSVPSLTRLLTDPSEWVRRNAAESLGIIGHPAEETVTGLTEALSDDHPYVRLNATMSLVRLKRETNAVDSGLRLALDDEKYYIQNLARDTLSSCQAEGK